MQVLVTGAGGFIASGLVERLLETGRIGGRTFDGLTVADLTIGDGFRDPRVRVVEGSLTDPQVRAAALSDNPDVVFHLASLPGRATSQDVGLGYSVNVEATVALFDDVAARRDDATIVFTSTIGVFGTPIPESLDDDTYPRPSMTYGAQKLMAEVAFTDLVRRERVKGCAVRLSSVVARPRSTRSAKSFASFVSDVFWAIAAGERYVVPVEPAATSWLMSRARCIDNLQHAAALGVPEPHQPPVCTLPALRVSIAQLCAEIGAHCGRPDVDKLISYAPNEDLQAQFGAYPEPRARLAESLGFGADASVAELVERVGVLRSGEPAVTR